MPQLPQGDQMVQAIRDNNKAGTAQQQQASQAKLFDFSGLSRNQTSHTTTSNGSTYAPFTPTQIKDMVTKAASENAAANAGKSTSTEASSNSNKSSIGGTKTSTNNPTGAPKWAQRYMDSTAGKNYESIAKAKASEMEKTAGFAQEKYYQEKIQQYKNQGYSEENAKKLAKADTAKTVTKAALGTLQVLGGLPAVGQAVSAGSAALTMGGTASQILQRFASWGGKELMQAILSLGGEVAAEKIIDSLNVALDGETEKTTGSDAETATREMAKAIGNSILNATKELPQGTDVARPKTVAEEKAVEKAADIAAEDITEKSIANIAKGGSTAKAMEDELTGEESNIEESKQKAMLIAKGGAAGSFVATNNIPNANVERNLIGAVMAQSSLLRNNPNLYKQQVAVSKQANIKLMKTVGYEATRELSRANIERIESNLTGAEAGALNQFASLAEQAADNFKRTGDLSGIEQLIQMMDQLGLDGSDLLSDGLSEALNLSVQAMIAEYLERTDVVMEKPTAETNFANVYASRYNELGEGIQNKISTETNGAVPMDIRTIQEKFISEGARKAGEYRANVQSSGSTDRTYSAASGFWLDPNQPKYKVIPGHQGTLLGYSDSCIVNLDTGEVTRCINLQGALNGFIDNIDNWTTDSDISAYYEYQKNYFNNRLKFDNKVVPTYWNWFMEKNCTDPGFVQWELGLGECLGWLPNFGIGNIYNEEPPVSSEQSPFFFGKDYDIDFMINVSQLNGVYNNLTCAKKKLGEAYVNLSSVGTGSNFDKDHMIDVVTTSIDNYINTTDVLKQNREFVNNMAVVESSFYGTDNPSTCWGRNVPDYLEFVYESKNNPYIRDYNDYAMKSSNISKELKSLDSVLMEAVPRSNVSTDMKAMFYAMHSINAHDAFNSYRTSALKISAKFVVGLVLTALAGPAALIWSVGSGALAMAKMGKDAHEYNRIKDNYNAIMSGDYDLSQLFSKYKYTWDTVKAGIKDAFTLIGGLAMAGVSIVKFIQGDIIGGVQQAYQTFKKFRNLFSVDRKIRDFEKSMMPRFQTLTESVREDDRRDTYIMAIINNIIPTVTRHVLVDPNQLAEMAKGWSKEYTTYDNEYEDEFDRLQGANMNQSNIEGYNEGIGSEEEMSDYFKNLIEKDPAARGLAQNMED